MKTESIDKKTTDVLLERLNVILNKYEDAKSKDVEFEEMKKIYLELKAIKEMIANYPLSQ